MVRLLMEAGADARKGIFPAPRRHFRPGPLREEREYRRYRRRHRGRGAARREEMSCPNATISPVQDRISAAIREGTTQTAIGLLEADGSLIHACDRDGATPLHIAAAVRVTRRWSNGCSFERRRNVQQAEIRTNARPLDRAALAADPRNDAAQHFPAIVAALLLDRGAQMSPSTPPSPSETRSASARWSQADPGLLRRIHHSGGLLTLAVNHGQIGIVRLLLDLGADVDERIFLKSWRSRLLAGACRCGTPRWPIGARSPNCCSTAAQTPTPTCMLPAGRYAMPGVTRMAC